MAARLRILALAALVAAPALAAGPSPTLRYAGTLADSDGRPLDGSFLLDFRIFDAASGSGASWSESRYVKAEQGRFTTMLGQRRRLPDSVMRGAYRLVVEAPAGTGWRAGAETVPTLDRPPAESAQARRAEAAPAAEPAREELPAQAPGYLGQLERELRKAKADAAKARADGDESRRRLDALERRGASEPQPASSTRIYTVRAGDTLRSVAADLLGDERYWLVIYQANSDRLQRAGELSPGQKLVIPAPGAP